MLPEVEYREVEGFPLYRIGSDGSVWSLNERSGRMRSEWRRMNPSKDKTGYLRVEVRNQDGMTRKLLHRLVLETFVGPCPDGMEACHGPDSNRTNCCISNLRWDTHIANCADRPNTAGEDNPYAILTNAIVEQIRNEYAAGFNVIKEIAKKYNVAENSIRYLLKGKSYKSAPGPIFQGSVRGVRAVYRQVA